MSPRLISTSFATLRGLVSGRYELVAGSEAHDLVTADGCTEAGGFHGPVLLRRLGPGVYAVQEAGEAEPRLLLFSRRRRRR